MSQREPPPRRDACHPQHLIDVKRVITWARTERATYGIDPGSIFVAGSSAGAHLAAMAALTAQQPTFQPGFETLDTSVSGAICMYGYYGPVSGANDTYTPIAGARGFAAALADRSDCPVVFAELPGAQHSFDVFHSVRFESAVSAIESFAARTRSVRRRPAS